MNGEDGLDGKVLARARALLERDRRAAAAGQGAFDVREGRLVMGPGRRPFRDEALALLRTAPGEAAAGLLALALASEPEDEAEAETLLAALPATLADAQAAAGRIALNRGRFAQAGAALARALALAPGHAEAARLRALAAIGHAGASAGRLERLEDDDLLDLGAFLWPAERLPGGLREAAAPIFAARAGRFEARGLPASRARALQVAAHLAPLCLDAWVGLARLMAEQGQFERAAAMARCALAIDPAHAEAGQLMALARAGDGGGGESLPAAERTRLGRALFTHLRFAEAEAQFRLALDDRPGDGEARQGLAEALYWQGRAAEAAALLAPMPPDPDRDSLLAMAMLSLGRAGEGWDLMDARFTRRRENSLRPVPPLPRWDGRPLAPGTSLLVWREEGLGDEIRFSSCLPEAVARARGRVVVECSPRLVGLLARSLPGAEVRAEDPGRPAPGDVQCHVPLLSLAALLRREPDDFRRSGAFLVPEPGRVAQWRRWLAGLGGGPVLGLSWKSGNPSWEKRPSQSALAEWGPVLGPPGRRWVCLQWRDEEGEIQAARRAFGAEIHVPPLDLENDVEGVAALAAALDGIVTTRNTVAALAGAVGARTWLLAAKPSPVLLDSDRDPWFPSVSVFWREGSAGSWLASLEAVAAELRQMEVEPAPVPV